MIEKEIALINKQLESLTAKKLRSGSVEKPHHHISGTNFWQRKHQSKDDQGTEIRLFELEPARCRRKLVKIQIRVILKAREILEATKLELEHLGVPKTGRRKIKKIWSLLEEELTGKQIREIKLVFTIGGS